MTKSHGGATSPLGGGTVQVENLNKSHENKITTTSKRDDTQEDAVATKGTAVPLDPQKKDEVSTSSTTATTTTVQRRPSVIV